MRYFRTIVLLAAAGALAACATARGGADGIARLEQARAHEPGSEPVLRSLGIAYYEAGRYADARTALEQAAHLDERDGTVALYLGMSAEQLNDLPAAHAAYAKYLQVGHTRRVRRQLEARLAALTRKEMQVRARTAIADEQQLSGVAGAATTVAVMPLTFSGADSSLAPLRRGLAELLITDLSRSAQLTVVERDRMQALLDELQLQQSGATDAATNVRAGKILQAGRVVEGSIVQQGQELRVDAAVIDVPTTQIAGSANDNRSLDQLFTLEKNIVFGLFETMHITLTTAERNAIEQRPTKSLAAFLAYSRGLGLEDEGQFDGANREFEQALRLDPGFGAAKQKTQEMQNLSAGASVTPRSVEQSLKGTAEGQIVVAATNGMTGAPAGGTVQTMAANLNPSQTGAAAGGGSGTGTQSTTKDGIASGSGADTPTNNTAHVVIVIKAP